MTCDPRSNHRPIFWSDERKEKPLYFQYRQPFLLLNSEWEILYQTQYQTWLNMYNANNEFWNQLEQSQQEQIQQDYIQQQQQYYLQLQNENPNAQYTRNTRNLNRAYYVKPNVLVLPRIFLGSNFGGFSPGGALGAGAATGGF